MIRPHIKKAKEFVETHDHSLINNEWVIKLPVSINGRKSTYNPDYICQHEKCFVEVATSVPNLAEQGPKWAAAIAAGYPLKVYWWEGQNITSKFSRKNGKKGGRPVTKKKV